jgi:hypothetical protein
MPGQSSLKRTVPCDFWNAVTSRPSDFDLQPELITLHNSLLAGEMTRITESHRNILVLLGNEHLWFDGSDSADIPEFGTTALELACRVLSCVQNADIPTDNQKELAVYFGVMGTMLYLRSGRPPNGFKTARMFSLLLSVYGDVQCVQTCNSSITNRVITTANFPGMLGDINNPHPDMKSGISLTKEMIARLKSSSMAWIRTPIGNWCNDSRPYDTRTKEWDEFLQFVLSSPFEKEAMGMLIGPIDPINPADYVPIHATGKPPLDEHANFRLARSEFCIELSCCLSRHFVAKMGPVQHALPFVINTFTNPPPNLNESRYPKGAYVTTIWIWFKNWRIQIDAFRN